MNATSLERVAHDVAVNEFRKAEESVSLLVEKKAEAQLLVSFIRKTMNSRGRGRASGGIDIYGRLVGVFSVGDCW